MPEKQTVRFYVGSTGRYMGWAYLNRKTYHNEIISWIRSGNRILIDNRIVNWINKDIFHINKYYSNLIRR